MVQISRKQADYIREHFPFAHINKTCKKKNKGKRKALDKALLYGTGDDKFSDYEERMLDMSYGYHGDTED